MKKGNTYFIMTYGPNIWHETTYLGMEPETPTTREKHNFRGSKGIYTVIKADIETRILTPSEKLVFDELEQTFAYNVENVQASKRIAAMMPEKEIITALNDAAETIEWLVENGNVYQTKIETFANITANSLEQIDIALNAIKN